MYDNNVKARDVKFDFRQCKEKYWFDNHPLKSVFANTVISGIPYGERFIVHCVKPLLKDIKDKAFRRRAWHFAKQEENHSRENFRLYHQMIRPYYPKLRLSKAWMYKLSLFVIAIVGKKMRFATIAATEHFTASTGVVYLNHPELLVGMDEKIRFLWLWHFCEEIEHKSVAFDLLKEVKCGYFTRVLGFFFATIFLAGCFFSPFFHMIIKDKLYRTKQFYKDLYHFFRHHSGLLKEILIPYLKFLKPGYHPSQSVNPEFMEHWKQNLALVEAQLKEKQYHGLATPFM